MDHARAGIEPAFHMRLPTGTLSTALHKITVRIHKGQRQRPRQKRRGLVEDRRSRAGNLCCNRLIAVQSRTQQTAMAGRLTARALASPRWMDWPTSGRVNWL